MRALTSSQVFVAKSVLLDGRLALFHEREKWLAIADLHFGYELSQRAAGNLFPLWGMDSAGRYYPPLFNYAPKSGHRGSCRAGSKTTLERIRECCDVIVIAGNHDRQLGSMIELVDSWKTKLFHFHHGHCGSKDHGRRIQIIEPPSSRRDAARRR